MSILIYCVVAFVTIASTPVFSSSPGEYHRGAHVNTGEYWKDENNFYGKDIKYDLHCQSPSTDEDHATRSSSPVTTTTSLTGAISEELDNLSRHSSSSKSPGKDATSKDPCDFYDNLCTSYLDGKTLWSFLSGAEDPVTDSGSPEAAIPSAMTVAGTVGNTLGLGIVAEDQKKDCGATYHLNGPPDHGASEDGKVNGSNPASADSAVERSKIFCKETRSLIELCKSKDLETSKRLFEYLKLILKDDQWHGRASLVDFLYLLYSIEKKNELIEEMDERVFFISTVLLDLYLSNLGRRYTPGVLAAIVCNVLSIKLLCDYGQLRDVCKILDDEWDSLDITNILYFDRIVVGPEGAVTSITSFLTIVEAAISLLRLDPHNIRYERWERNLWRGWVPFKLENRVFETIDHKLWVADPLEIISAILTIAKENDESIDVEQAASHAKFLLHVATMDPYSPRHHPTLLIIASTIVSILIGGGEDPFTYLIPHVVPYQQDEITEAIQAVISWHYREDRPPGCNHIIDDLEPSTYKRLKLSLDMLLD